MVLSFLVNNSDTKKCKVLIGPHWPSWSSDLLIPLYFAYFKVGMLNHRVFMQEKKNFMYSEY